MPKLNGCNCTKKKYLRFLRWDAITKTANHVPMPEKKKIYNEELIQRLDCYEKITLNYSP